MSFCFVGFHDQFDVWAVLVLPFGVQWFPVERCVEMELVQTCSWTRNELFQFNGKDNCFCFSTHSYCCSHWPIACERLLCIKLTCGCSLVLVSCSGSILFNLHYVCIVNHLHVKKEKKYGEFLRKAYNRQILALWKRREGSWEGGGEIWFSYHRRNWGFSFIYYTDIENTYKLLSHTHPTDNQNTVPHIHPVYMHILWTSVP